MERSTEFFILEIETLLEHSSFNLENMHFYLGKLFEVLARGLQFKLLDIPCIKMSSSERCLWHTSIYCMYLQDHRLFD